MYEKVSDQVIQLAMDVVIAGMDKVQMNEFMKSLSPEDFEAGLKMWQSGRAKPGKQALTTGKNAILWAQVLLQLLGAGSAMAGPSQKNVSDEMNAMKNKGTLTVERITDFKQDLPPEATGAGVQDYSEINKLVEDAKGQSVQQKQKEQGFSSAPISIGDQKFMPANPREWTALKAMARMIEKLQKENDPGLKQAVEKLQMAFKTKKPVK